ncbi:hypothetical protein L596_012949 [Steinernema carpocapsae]|uniref:t-SNARE coiled-coil homology domain-containing protein n=1 Tax=Steinernema carpocapsae TaxID=34508 RepID=A0A4U5NZD4_STECR|nr:hypothetical protein L596_012949 [Steinernema carpocapsae]
MNWSVEATRKRLLDLLSANTFPAVQQNNPLLRHDSPSAPITFEMSCRDRTNEFRNNANSVKIKTKMADGHLSKNDRTRMVQESVQFNQLARRIGKDLSQTCAKMEKLAELAKKKSLFEERAGEIEELSNIIRLDITGLNKQISTLQEYKNNRFGVASASRKDQGEGHSKLVVVGLQTKLASVSKIFQNVLELRTENMKRQKNRRDMFQRSQIFASPPPSSTVLDMDTIQQQQQVQIANEQNAYVQSRTNAMEHIEAHISELGSIFTQLASLISEQGEMITRIDAKVEETSMNVDAAHVELLRYFNAISKNRWLILKIFGVLTIFFVVFVVFLS